MHYPITGMSLSSLPDDVAFAIWEATPEQKRKIKAYLDAWHKEYGDKVEPTTFTMEVKLDQAGVVGRIVQEGGT